MYHHKGDHEKCTLESVTFVSVSLCSCDWEPPGRSLLLAELEKEEKEKDWYYAQLQNLTKRIDSLPLTENVNHLTHKPQLLLMDDGELVKRTRFSFFSSRSRQTGAVCSWSSRLDRYVQLWKNSWAPVRKWRGELRCVLPACPCTPVSFWMVRFGTEIEYTCVSLFAFSGPRVPDSADRERHPETWSSLAGN